jgi:2-polyprenyl-3-methyl-5-hydroxy-6-metoxy-1,4-benzoquinol methylase
MTASANEAAIARWSAIPTDVLAAFDPEGDFGRRHLLNSEIFRLLGDVRGKRVLDAGCGQGYLSRLLAERGATVVGVEPAGGMFEYAVARERERRQAIRYVQADLASLPDLASFPELGGPFDAVVSNVVLEAIPDWEPALRSCVKALRPGGTLVFSIEHPCFEDGRTSWVEKGCVEVREYLAEYERPTRAQLPHRGRSQAACVTPATIRAMSRSA